MNSGNAAKIKGPLKNTKENIVKAIAKVEKKKYETPSAYKARMKKEKLAEIKPVKKVPVKPRGGRGGMGGGVFGIKNR
jgi:hypothetical protein